MGYIFCVIYNYYIHTYIYICGKYKILWNNTIFWGFKQQTLCYSFLILFPSVQSALPLPQENVHKLLSFSHSISSILQFLSQIQPPKKLSSCIVFYTLWFIHIFYSFLRIRDWEQQTRGNMNALSFWVLIISVNISSVSIHSFCSIFFSHFSLLWYMVSHLE